MLDRLAKLSSRVVTAPMTDDHDSLVKALTKNGLADAYLDLSPPAISSGHLKSAIMALRKGGRVSLMGGIMADLALPMGAIVFNDIELKGQWMYSSTVVRDMLKLVESGVLDLSKIGVAGKFGLDQWEQAFDVAASMRFDQVTVFSAW
jgi:threonine dehydrogenase-like Zn-dependent dehydrogenase